MRDVIKYLEKHGKTDYAKRVANMTDLLDDFCVGMDKARLLSEREESERTLDFLTKKLSVLSDDFWKVQQHVKELRERVKELEKSKAVVYQPQALRIDVLGTPFNDRLFQPCVGGDKPHGGEGFDEEAKDFKNYGGSD